MTTINLKIQLVQKIISFLIVIFLVSCSSEDDSSPELVNQNPSENGEGGSNNSNDVILTFNVEGIEGFDYSAHHIASPFEIESIGNDKTFKEPKQISNSPILILDKEDEVVFGYYPESIDNKEIEIDDILLFFVATHPEMTLYSKPIKQIQEKLGVQDNSQLNTLIKESLKQNLSPISDEKFIVKLGIAMETILENLDTDRSPEVNFEVKFKRYGVFEIPNKAPLFSSLGVGLYDVDENILEFKVLKSKSVIFSPASYAQKYFNEVIEYINPDPNILRDNGITEQAWTHDGEMEVQISNGRRGVESMERLSNYVATHNSKMLATILLAYIVPEALFSDEASICTNTIKEKLHKESILLSARLLSAIENDGLSPFFISQQLEIISKTLSDLILQRECYNTFMKTYLAAMIQSAFKHFKRLDVLDKLETLYQFVNLELDFKNSIVHEKYTLRFDKDNIVLFSPELKYTGPETNVLSGSPGDAVTFNANYKETLTKYKVINAALETKFIPIKYQVPSEGLPFKIQKLSGDTDYPEGSLTNANGELKLNFDLNEEDSEFKIIPDFKYSNLSDETVKITIDDDEEENNGEYDLSGDWKLCSGTLISATGCTSDDPGTCWNYGKVKFLEDNILSFPINYGTPSEEVLESFYEVNGNNLFFLRKTIYEGTSSTVNPETGEVIKYILRREQTFDGEILSEGLIKGIYKYYQYVTYTSYHDASSCTVKHNASLTR